MLDFRDADLAGSHITLRALPGARFDGADLRGARFETVDLTGASFRGAWLDNTSFTLVRAGGANFDSVHAISTLWDRSCLAGASFKRAILHRSSLTSCGLEGSVLDRADLTLGSLAYSTLDGASLEGTNLDRVETIGVNLRDADLRHTRLFAQCREVVFEILWREARDHPAAGPWLGAACLKRTWCYPVWAQILREEPVLLNLARSIFEKYPASGCAQALAAGAVLDANTRLPSDDPEPPAAAPPTLP